MKRALENYIEELKSDVASRVYSEGVGASFEDKFTEYCIEVLESIGKSEGARVLSYVHPNSQGGIDWKINGFCLKDFAKDENKKEYYETLDLFITFYKSEYDYNITKDEYTKSLNQIKRFINSALKRHIDYIDKSNTELHHLIGTIGKQGKEFDRINVYFLINGFSNHEKEKLEIAGADVFVHTWDVSRLFKINESNSVHEPIEIEFDSFTEDGKGLQCLRVPSIDEMYDCYLAIVPGEILAKLYKEYSNELLESNVRVFLGQAGKFNKGIRDTIRTKPQMFLPYNNGITATAESVETRVIDNQLVISKLNDFQIVNGGQTTASLYHTQKKFKDADLSKIFVQMKLTVIKDKEQKNIEVPNISRFANSQNKVTELDLSSNNPYFIQIESLSRKKYVINPENRNQSFLWFFERANGQYRETLNKLTPAQQSKFKEQNPPILKFVKSDIAKFINIWELEPHIVAQGSQKSFIHYTKKITELVIKGILPSDNFYRKLIANAILYKTADKLIGRKGVDSISDNTRYKAYIIAYSLSYLHYVTNNRIDLWKIYEEQKVERVIQDQLRKLIVFVDSLLFPRYLPDSLKEKPVWEDIKRVVYQVDLIKELKDVLISEEEKIRRDSEKEIDTSKDENRLFVVSKIYDFGLQFWDGFVKYLRVKPLEDFNVEAVNDLFKNLKNEKNLTLRDIRIGGRTIDLLSERPDFYEGILTLSNLKNSQPLELKAVYDKLLLFSRSDWNRIIDLAGQRNIFNNLELANLKNVSSSLIRKEQVKERSLISAYESIKKLRKYGVEI